MIAARTNSEQLRILLVAYPLLPVTEASCGGAEQVLQTLERELQRHGHETTIAGCAGSTAAGEVAETVAQASKLDAFDDVLHEHIKSIRELVHCRSAQGVPFDLIHDQSGFSWPQLRSLGTPLLVTLHLPRSFYDQSAFIEVYPQRSGSVREALQQNIHFNCVSESQAASFREIGLHPALIENGVDLERFRPATNKSDRLLWLGRICEEKGTHLAIAAARAAGMPLIIAGDVFPFSSHQEYFEREIAPKIDGQMIQFLRVPCQAEKIRLLQEARAVIVSSLANETSSLVAMEAAACGTPVVALRRGALAEIVCDGVTGFLVDSCDRLAAAISKLNSLNTQNCRKHAERNFQSSRMADAYLRLYRLILAAQSGAELKSSNECEKI